MDCHVPCAEVPVENVTEHRKESNSGGYGCNDGMREKRLQSKGYTSFSLPRFSVRRSVLPDWLVLDTNKHGAFYQGN